jgi:NAD(P)-dependent dehydrogenase (short-subunit alcohol dehydrogenase family)
MSPKTAVVTGASTGIGRATALHLDRLGWNVFAGVRKDSDGDSLAKDGTSRLIPIRLDVTDDAAIKEVAQRIEIATEHRGLDGLVNNAGITVQGPVEYLSLEDLRKQLEVNVIGQVAVTQALLPAIRKATGRIVFMSSIAGRAPALPFLAPYSASKKAIESVAEALRLELLPWKIRVSVIEPGSVATPIWEKGDATFDGLIAELPSEGRERYESILDRARKVAAMTGDRGIQAEKVAAKVEHALTSKRPRFRYLVGIDARARAMVERPMPNRLRDRAIGKLLGYGKPR